ncbi:unnamed protein product [Blepharisma stoltei]|uniref:C2HC/C3H-type domain-containing protein n=1 Tax=Blepharisma stoltei TaxID=1481888 RepID=A0AAU9JPT0_9CILI|nr:unnamed protein product [Blepharisma stoltei]
MSQSLQMTPKAQSLSLASSPSYFSSNNLDEYKNMTMLDNSNLSPLSETEQIKSRVSSNDFYNEDLRAKCQSCGRKFFSDRIDKHQQACFQVQKKRPKFKILEKILPQIERREEKQQKPRRSPLKEYKDKNWYKKHQDFINKIKILDISTIVEENAGDFAINSPTSLEDTYTQCPHCGRRFAPLPAERHIPKCKDIINKPKPLRIVLKDKISLPNIYFSYNKNNDNESGSLNSSSKISIFSSSKTRKISPESEDFKYMIQKLTMEEKIKDSIKRRYTVKHILCTQCNSFLSVGANFCSMCGTKQSFKPSY